MMCHFFDPHNKVPEVEPATVDEFLEYWNQLLKKRGITQDNLSFIITGGVIEVSSEFANVSDLDLKYMSLIKKFINFRKENHLISISVMTQHITT